MNIENKYIVVKFHSTKKDYIIINFRDSFRNKKWADYFGLIQRIGKEGSYNNIKINQILFDISDCQWVDPLPILSLLVFIKSYKRKFKIYIKVAIYGNKKETDIVLKHLARENFFKNVNDINIFSGNTLVNEEQINSFLTSDVDLNYLNSRLIPFTVENLSEIEKKYTNIESWLDPFIEEMRTKLIGFIQENQVDFLIYKAKIFFGETIHNVIKHAYQGDEKYCGFFCRLRFGTQNQAISEFEKNIIKDSVNREKHHCPRLEPEFIMINQIFIELFITDSGQGIFESMKKVIQLKSKYPFRELCEEIFLKGNKSNKSKDFTQFGGLFTIGKLFENNYDYLCGKELNEWVGDFLPFESRYSYQVTSASENNLPDVTGLSWIGRISPNNYQKNENENWTYWDGSFLQHAVYIEMKTNSIFIQDEILQFKVIDNRHFINDVISELYTKFQKKLVELVNDKYILLFSKRNLSKTGVWLQLEELAEPLNQTCVDRVLFIVDIPENEKPSYISALSNPKFTKRKWPLNFSKIYLVSKDFSICVLVLKQSKISLTYVIDSDLSYSFLNSNISQHFLPEDSLSHLYRWIKMYESVIFWERLALLNFKNCMFINGKIKWNNDISEINGYLNFSQTLADDFLKKLYRANIERCKGFFIERTCFYNSMDVLTASIIEEINSENSENETFEHKNTVNIGSVYVTGTKERDTLFGAKSSEISINIHFFIHGSSQNHHAAFFNWPSNNFFDENDSFKSIDSDIYERVGRSHVIAKHGWKYFPIPRYKVNNESFYLRTPSDSYRDWQSSYYKLIKIGNYKYNDYYDLFKIDLRRALLMSFEFKEELAKFLLEEFLFALHGTNERFLSSNGKSFLEKLDFNCSIRKSFYKDIVAVVYPSHSNTSFAIEKIKECIAPELTKKIFPIIPIKDKRDGSSLLISPLIFDSIETLLNEKTGRKEILFFDDCLVSGRTRKEIKHIMIGLGADDIKTLIIMDRNRLPFQIPSENTHRGYWRLDIPRLGDHDNNPINKAINELTLLENKLIDPLLKYRIKTIQKNWSGIYQYQDNSNIGLNSSKITILHNKNKKRFGIEKLPPHNQIGGDINMINITSSLGLTIYVTEIQAITGKDDLAMNILENKNYILSNEAKIELIGSQILLFENEYPKELHYEMLKQLFISSFMIQKSNNHTAFASIVLISQDRFYLEKLVLDERIIELFQKTGFDKCNVDLVIFFCFYFLNCFDKASDNKQFVHFEKFFQETHQLNIDTLRELHFEIYDSNGKLHDTAILRLCESYGDSTKYRLEKARFSFLNIKGIIKDKLFGCIPRNDIMVIDSEYINLLKDKYDPLILKNLIISSLDKYFFETQEILNVAIWNEKNIPKLEEHSIRINNLVLDIKNNLLGNLRLYHSCLTYPLKGKIEAERPLEDFIQKLINSINIKKLKEEAINRNQTQHFMNDILISLSKPNDFNLQYKQKKNIWIILDEKIKNQIFDLILNSIFSTFQISDYWDEKSNKEANLWISIVYDKDFVQIIFVNAFNGDLEYVENKFLNNRVHEKNYLKKMNCSFSFKKEVKDGTNLIFINFSIPILN